MPLIACTALQPCKLTAKCNLIYAGALTQDAQDHVTATTTAFGSTPPDNDLTACKTSTASSALTREALRWVPLHSPWGFSNSTVSHLRPSS